MCCATRPTAAGERMAAGRCPTLHMQEPQITYRGMPHSPAMDQRIREHIQKLEEFHPQITQCRVVVDEPHGHKHKGNLFEVRVDVHVPGKELVATHQPHEDAYAAITKAFDVMYRQLEDYQRIQRGDVKHHRDERGDNSTP
jgi:ribosomal subunit interface protein